MMKATPFHETYSGLRVLVTGHTGFKGAWLSLWLAELGAKVIGFSDRVPTNPSLFVLATIGDRIEDRRGDIRNPETIAALVQSERPQVIFHLAAQPIVRKALADPFGTVATNVLGTVAVLEAARHTPGVRAVIVVTSDKVYRDKPIATGYSETHCLGGQEPYGASKAAAELVTEVYQHAGFHHGSRSSNVSAVATARAGNVIGGGDWASHRIVPDVVRAICEQRDIVLRYPLAVRPWQHVLEPLSGYLLLGQALSNADGAGLSSVNFGPFDSEPMTVQELVDIFLSIWGRTRTRVLSQSDGSGVETAFLRVDSSLARTRLGWRALWDARRAIHETAKWYKAWADGVPNLQNVSRKLIEEYMEEAVARHVGWAGRPPKDRKVFAE